MKKEIHELIDSVRALGIELTDKPSPKCIRISGEIADFADRLRRVQVALEAVDAAGSKSVDNEAGLEGVNDPVKLRSAIDGLIRFIQVKGDYLTEADAIVRSALGLTEGQHDKSKGSLPSLTPSKMKKKRTYRPRLNIYPERPGEASINDLKKIVHEISVTESLLGGTLAKPVRAAERSKLKAFGKPIGM